MSTRRLANSVGVTSLALAAISFIAFIGLATSASAEQLGKSPQQCIILDDEDIDEDGVCGVAIRLPSESRVESPVESTPRADAKPTKQHVPDNKTYRVVLDEEDESNESGFGIALPTLENPTPWNSTSSTNDVEEYEFLQDD